MSPLPGDTDINALVRELRGWAWLDLGLRSDGGFASTFQKQRAQHLRDAADLIEGLRNVLPAGILAVAEALTDLTLPEGWRVASIDWERAFLELRDGAAAVGWAQFDGEDWVAARHGFIKVMEFPTAQAAADFITALLDDGRQPSRPGGARRRGTVRWGRS